MSGFDLHRGIVDIIIEKITNEKFKDIIQEFEKAIQELICKYPTSIYENRFVVGNAIEIIFCAFLKCLEFNCNRLDNEKRYDIEIDNCKFSIKSNFRGSGDIRLINVMGNNKKIRWKEPTFVFISGEGIYYIDPDKGITTRRRGDAITVSIYEIKTKGKKILDMNISRDVGRNNQKNAPMSKIVAMEILKNINSEHLIRNL